ncbi:MAG: efflux RND transporter periplasmic adaptor subunit [Thermoanaerobaculia bacterium]
MSTAAGFVDPLAMLEEESGGRGWWRRSRLILLGLVLACVGLAAFASFRGARRPSAPLVRTENAVRGDLTVRVSANGTLQPTNKVDVGSEVSGLIEAVLVEENERVRTGQVLARLDVTKLTADVVNQRAALSSAEAKVLQTEATVRETAASVARLKAVSELSGGKVPAKMEMESAEAALARARADETSARAAVEQARASLRSGETTLSKAWIRSPIDGVVLARKIEPGQTVVASFSTPVLFTLAEDLSKMQLQVDVDEADVGQVYDGQTASFHVDAYPAREYPATITRVAYGSQTKDGVVSYKATLKVDNRDLTLRPGMTASAEITTVERKGVLLVPNAALRFVPAATSETPTRGARGIASSLLPGATEVSKGSAGRNKSREQKVYQLTDGTLQPLNVTVGASDGSLTEVTGSLAEGAAVAVESGASGK